jgi:hypothetical protein
MKLKFAEIQTALLDSQVQVNPVQMARHLDNWQARKAQRERRKETALFHANFNNVGNALLSAALARVTDNLGEQVKRSTANR